jgi:pimeloyl-ACP methyl ester carboxylesterase
MPVLRRLDESDRIDRVHFVTHSMGGIVARVALQHQPLKKPGRLVMIAPPNRGTPLATRFSWLPRWLFRPLPELTDDPRSFVNLLQPPQGLQTGIIAASHDIIVPIACTHLDGQCDHIVIRGLHTHILFRRQTAEQVLAFLHTGRFTRE